MCERCRSKAKLPGFKYCEHCLSIVKLEIKRSNYFVYVPRREYRPPEAKELTKETKFGVNH